MTDSFQNEIPKARVNITLDVETGGARKKKELPLKILAMGDYSHGKTKGTVAERERININKNNFDKVINDLAPELEMAVPNTIKDDATDLKVNLAFKKLKDFHPVQVANQIPELRNLLAMRNLLKDLKANLLDNKAFRRELERIVKDAPELQGLKAELNKLAPINSDA